MDFPSGEKTGFKTPPLGIAVPGIGSDFNPSQTTALTLEQAVLKTKRQFVENVFVLADGDYKKAAAILRRHPKYMHRFLEKLGLSHLLKYRPA